MNAITSSGTLTAASRQWASRPADERYTDLDQIIARYEQIHSESRAVTVASRRVNFLPSEDNKGLLITGPNGHAYAPTHHAFNQIATLAGTVRASDLRKLPAPLAADCLNYGLQFHRDVEDVKVLLQRPDGTDPILRAATGPAYGYVWQKDFVRALRDRFGNGVDGDFRVPGEFGVQVPITKANTTLFAGDRDCFLFLADEEHRIEVPNRRDGKSGTLARGFFAWNSEVGACSYGLATFLFDYACCNRIVWGATQYKEVRFRHTASAPEQFIEQVTPALLEYQQSSTSDIEQAIVNARKARLDDVDAFLAKRFSRNIATELKAVHLAEENRPIETIWDVTTAVTAKARNINYQNDRVELEREGGAIFDLAQ